MLIDKESCFYLFLPLSLDNAAVKDYLVSASVIENAYRDVAYGQLSADDFIDSIVDALDNIEVTPDDYINRVHDKLVFFNHGSLDKE